MITIHFHWVEKSDMNILQNFSFCVLRRKRGHNDRIILGGLAIPLIVLADTEYYTSCDKMKIAADNFFCIVTCIQVTTRIPEVLGRF